eukprot:2166136-Rhodomonas_salina.4
MSILLKVMRHDVELFRVARGRDVHAREDLRGLALAVEHALEPRHHHVTCAPSRRHVGVAK